MAIKTFIFGSCVSRDILNYQNDEIELVDYFARSSFASMFEFVPVKDIYTKNLKSNFQRRTVAADLSKKFSDHINGSLFDLLLLDFIDERFNLFVFENNAMCTLSNELISAGFDPKRELGRIVKSGTDEFFDLWEKGWVQFLSIVDALGCRQKIRINRVFWATMTVEGEDFPTYNKNYILDSNRFLARLYTRVGQDLEPCQFLENNPGFFLGAKNHRWGLSPFHYIDAYYFDALRRLLNSQAKPQEVKSSEPTEEVAPSLVSPAMGTNAEICEYPFDRSLISWKRFVAKESEIDPQLSSCKSSGNCEVIPGQSTTMLRFSRDGGTHQARFSLSEPIRANGMAVKIRLENWGALRYLAFGYTHQDTFRHIKVVNPAQGQWITLNLLHGDIAFGLQNDWEHPPPADVSDFRLYLRAEPRGIATIEIEHFICWEEAENTGTGGLARFHGCYLIKSLSQPIC